MSGYLNPFVFNSGVVGGLYFRLVIDDVKSPYYTTVQFSEVLINGASFNMTSNTSGGCIASNSAGSASAWRHWDGVRGAGAPFTIPLYGWTQIKAAAPIVVTSFSVAGANAAPTYGPKGFSFYQSSTGSFSGEETLLKSVSGKTWTAMELATFSVP